MFEMAIARTNNSLIQKNYALSVILKVKTEEISSSSKEEEEKSSLDSLIGAEEFLRKYPLLYVNHVSGVRHILIL
jgi:hypothetical protein